MPYTSSHRRDRVDDFPGRLRYNDYHDVITESKLWTTEAPAPATAHVTATLAQVITSALRQDGGGTLDQSKIQRLVESLPLTKLSILGHPLSDAHEAQEGQEAEVAATLPRNTSAIPPIDMEHWRSIEEVVQESGNLQDMALLACMRSGMRAHEYLRLSARDLKWSGAGVDSTPFLEFKPTKLHQHGDYRAASMTHPILAISALAIRKYVQSAKLSANDLLFPSAKDSERPMTTHYLGLRCRSWEIRAKLKSGTFTPHAARRSVTDKAITVNRPVGLAELGHSPLHSTLDYVRPIGPNTED
ncbi:hypothetical protein [Pseudomonas viridiflava]|uniref:hypothetical protein n=1 Tax=Pseudomonas viridiflava TaxID=33069 RepID=UPI001303064B|nr:hypothetical protein [Pseudomonas viridiflava]